jgi:hypothetical protein
MYWYYFWLALMSPPKPRYENNVIPFPEFAVDGHIWAAAALVSC